MNIFILKTMRYLDNPELFTVAEMKKDASDAHAYATSTAAASSTAVAVDFETSTDANYWLNKYFKESYEDKQNYINEVERLR